jgi:hypothetical protein
VIAYGIGAGPGGRELRAVLEGGGNTGLADPEQFAGFVDEDDPKASC